MTRPGRLASMTRTIIPAEGTGEESAEPPDDDERPRPASRALQPQALQEPWVRDDRVRPPDDHEVQGDSRQGGGGKGREETCGQIPAERHPRRAASEDHLGHATAQGQVNRGMLAMAADRALRNVSFRHQRENLPQLLLANRWT